MVPRKTTKYIVVRTMGSGQSGWRMCFFSEADNRAGPFSLQGSRMAKRLGNPYKFADPEKLNVQEAIVKPLAAYRRALGNKIAMDLLELAGLSELMENTQRVLTDDQTNNGWSVPHLTHTEFTTTRFQYADFTNPAVTGLQLGDEDLYVINISRRLRVSNDQRDILEHIDISKDMKAFLSTITSEHLREAQALSQTCQGLGTAIKPILRSLFLPFGWQILESECPATLSFIA